MHSKLSTIEELIYRQFLFFAQSPMTNRYGDIDDFKFLVPPLCAVYREILYIPHTTVGRETQNLR